MSFKTHENVVSKGFPAAAPSGVRVMRAAQHGDGKLHVVGVLCKKPVDVASVEAGDGIRDVGSNAL